ncbi:25150_t:CDS:2, partial [Gigaspora margarita]
LQPFDLKIWQNNLNCQIIYKANELNLTIRHEPDFWKIYGTGPHFLINEEGTKLITWKQIKFIRGKSCKGKTATWFSSIEKKYLTNSSNREISEGLSIYNPNNMSIMPNKADIKEDNRIKDWVLIEERENSMTIRRVAKKRKREVLVEHWQDKNVILKRDKIEQEDIQGVYSKIQNVANQKVLPVSKEVIAKKKTGNIEA